MDVPHGDERENEDGGQQQPWRSPQHLGAAATGIAEAHHLYRELDEIIGDAW